MRAVDPVTSPPGEGRAGRRRGNGLAPVQAGVRAVLSVRTFDLLARDVRGDSARALRADPRFSLERVTGLAGSPLSGAPGERDWPWLDRLTRPAPLRQARCAYRAHRRQRRFRRHDVAYVALVDGQVAGWAWLRREQSFRCPWSGLHLRFGEHEGYLYDLWSVPAYRAHGVGALVIRGLLEDLRTRGDVERVYGVVERDNRPSQVLHRLVLGFEQVQQVKDVTLLTRALAWQLPRTAVPPAGPCSRPRQEVGRPAPAGGVRPVRERGVG